MAGTLYLTIDGVGTMFESLGTTGLDRIPRNKRKVLIKAALDATMRWWMTEWLPLRFRKGSAQRFGYDPEASTLARKRRMARRPETPEADLPNVVTGATRAAAFQSRFDSRGTPEAMRGALVMRLPGYVNRQRSQLTNRVVRNITAQELRPLWTRFRELLSAMTAGATGEDLAALAARKSNATRYPKTTRSISTTQG